MKNTSLFLYKFICLENREYLIFRHVSIKQNCTDKSSVVLVLKFQFDYNSVEKDRIISLFQIPAFVGIPGFKGKLWTCDKENNYFQGIYQWKSINYAKNYLNSYSVDFVKKKAKKNTVSYTIYEDTNLQNFINNNMKRG